jgi:hypothetical protein
VTSVPLTDLVPLGALLAEAAEWCDAPVTDLVVDLAIDPARVVGVVDGRDRGARTESGVTGPSGGSALPLRAPEAPLHGTELCLVRDVLDTRVWDSQTLRPARVGEIWLRCERDQAPEVAGLEVGVHPVWRRLTSTGRSDRPVGQLLDLNRTPLVSRHGRAAQAALQVPPTSLLTDEELAHLITWLPAEGAVALLDQIGEARAAAVVDRLHPHVRHRIQRARSDVLTGEHRRFRRTAG